MKLFGQGLMALIPIGLTIGIIAFFVVWVQRLVVEPFRDFMPGSSDFTRGALGLAAFFIIVCLFGLMLRLWLVRRLFETVEHWIVQLPLIKTVYGAIKDIMGFVGSSGGGKGDMVVVVTLDNGWRQLGIVTRQDFAGLPPALTGGRDDMMAVYIPFSYQLGGFTYFIEKEKCEPVHDMKVEDAMRYAIMAWLGSDKKPQRPGTDPT